MPIKESTYKKYCLVIDEWFVNGFNGTKAYQTIYTNSDYNTADKGFREIHEIPRIKEYIKEKEITSKNILKTSHERVLQELRNWAYSDITETISLTPEEVKELPIEIRRLITRFKETKRNLTDKDGNIYETIHVIELWFVDKTKALDMINKHVGFYGEHNAQKQPQSNISLNIDGEKIQLK